MLEYFSVINYYLNYFRLSECLNVVVVSVLYK